MRLGCLLALARARADCASPSLVAFASSRATRAETRVFEAEQAVVTRGACVTRRGRREAWFALGDDGSTGALRDKYCGGGGGPRATLAHNGTRGSAVGGVRDLSFKAARRRWRRMGTGPVVLASDWLSNVGHAARDVLLLSAFAREWCGAKPPTYALLESRRPAPWAREFFDAVAAARGAPRLAVADGATVCVGGLVQKAAQHVGDAEDARSARDAALARCGVAGAAAPDGLLHVVHGPSREGDRAVAGVAGALKTVARRFGLRERAAELGNLSFCDQVGAVYASRLVVGVFGAAIGGNVVLAHDAALTVELTACGHSRVRAEPLRRNLGHSFQPLAVATAKGYLSFCLCVDDDAVDLAAKRTTTRGWFRSGGLRVNAAALERALGLALDGDLRGASREAAREPCGAA
ncbi:hypothetical protein JL720_4789 [Aureococcus anophagefferens]|nr:hypothetical protein JL720_4789 [Aureococcus anophagefferens]